MAGRRTHPSILTLVILPLQEPQIHKEIEDIDELKPYSPASQEKTFRTPGIRIQPAQA
jgi:hypothetical protein